MQNNLNIQNGHWAINSDVNERKSHVRNFSSKFQKFIEKSDVRALWLVLIFSFESE